MVVANPLAEKSLTFWEISRAFHRHQDASNVTVSEAMHQLNDLAAHLGPSRQLSETVLQMSWWIITGEKSKENIALQLEGSRLDELQ